MIVSQVNAAIEPILYAMLRKRIKMYKPIAINARTTDQIAPVLISSAMLGPTFCELTILPPVWLSRSMKVAYVIF